MKTRLIIACVFAAALLTACASTPQQIVSIPEFQPVAAGQTAAAPSLPIPITNKTLVTDLQSATFNLDQAVAIGALPADDPAAACFHSILQEAGIEAIPGATPPQSFAPKNDGIASLGSILYIQIQQAKALKGTGIVVAQTCKTLLGQFVLDGAAGLAKGASLATNPLGVLNKFLP